MQRQERLTAAAACCSRPLPLAAQASTCLAIITTLAGKPPDLDSLGLQFDLRGGSPPSLFMSAVTPQRFAAMLADGGCGGGQAQPQETIPQAYFWKGGAASC